MSTSKLVGPLLAWGRFSHLHLKNLTFSTQPHKLPTKVEKRAARRRAHIYLHILSCIIQKSVFLDQLPGASAICLRTFHRNGGWKVSGSAHQAISTVLTVNPVSNIHQLGHVLTQEEKICV